MVQSCFPNQPFDETCIIDSEVWYEVMKWWSWCVFCEMRECGSKESIEISILSNSLSCRRTVACFPRECSFLLKSMLSARGKLVPALLPSRGVLLFHSSLLSLVTFQPWFLWPLCLRSSWKSRQSIFEAYATNGHRWKGDGRLRMSQPLVIEYSLFSWKRPSRLRSRSWRNWIIWNRDPKTGKTEFIDVQ